MCVMGIFKIFLRALIFLTRLCFPPGNWIANKVIDHSSRSLTIRTNTVRGASFDT